MSAYDLYLKNVKMITSLVFGENIQQSPTT